MENFDYFYRKLTQTTLGALFSTLGLFVLTLVCAALGFANAVTTFNGITLALAYAFGILLAVFLLTSLVRALVHFLVHRGKALS